MDAFKVRIVNVKPRPGWEMLNGMVDSFGQRYWWPSTEYFGGDVLFRSIFNDHFTQRFMVTR